MTSKPLDEPLDRLAPEVLRYSVEHFALQDDLANLQQVQAVGASEAVILYCARILEVLAIQALKALELRSSSSLLSNLDALHQYNLMPTTTWCWCQALRRIGNSARHILRRVAAEEAECSVLFTERLLSWFFCGFRFGRQLPSLGRGQVAFELRVNDELRSLIGALDAGELNVTILQPPSAGGSHALLQTPALAAVLVELRLEHEEYDAARKVLEAALAWHPQDLRLRQLRGLALSREKNFNEALKELELLESQGPDDEETIGITAGVYKRRWLDAKNEREWLAKAQRAYRHGWKCSKRNNAYLGVNAATTALWLERPDEARQLAAEVEKLLGERAATLAKHKDDPDLAYNYWDRVTLAEAQVLLGKFADARRNYEVAFAKHPKQKANIAVTRAQLDEILRALGQEGTVFPQDTTGPRLP